MCHLKAVVQTLRVARELRIFSLLTLKSRPSSPPMEPLMIKLQHEGWDVTIEPLGVRIATWRESDDANHTSYEKLREVL